jgi:cell division protein FtsA
MGFGGATGGQVVLTGGGAELHGIAEFTQAALGRPVRIGKPPALQGLPEAHATPGFATLAGLCLYAADDPVDIRSVGLRYQPTRRYRGIGLVNRVVQAVKEYF